MDDHQDNPDGSESEPEKNPIVASELRKYNLTQENVKVLQMYRNEWKNAKGTIRTGIAVKAYREMLKGDTAQLDKKAWKLKRQVKYNSPLFLQQN